MDWFDRLPSREKERLRKRLRSPGEYERLRERVKGPEDLEREMEKNELLAELKFALETEPKIQEELRKEIEKDLREQGAEQILEAGNLTPKVQDALASGAFTVGIDVNPSSGNEQIVLQPEGNVAEKIPLQKSVSEQYTAGFMSAGSSEV
ncbi:hypothetical protein A2454_04095 [Candidatus Peribacteria bacterium RIFOXYC2_FULL_55_14]|nr:MAG: hypothetical protein UY85_C0057G0003 [Candidatus Peribacteria bacterium GW2011_GWB1_54_5]OGJ72234.1 MAG: hypothetical protein A2198_02295 [Candidatus Peribacteria bacterium RIFOXYA1_FULL_56_14]OGJ73603.1 MAG: hypothetical protein A2217_03875 [Candidatus Peribacteria bacterium RIFOXYA2_FULL_55_28]OGJ75807.1 MAG: hypothetical protein A2384_02430 [Candidatus Peribacteria bacterium RIFOXYB1_FULL_54_35]OGJ77011.1 MAG: hypothetical protein A2327_02250 [Candidatus Peribacteria bacterium RIFOXY